MKNQLNTIFKKINFPFPSAGLGEKMLLQIQIMENRRQKKILLITRIGRTLSILAFLFMGFSFGQRILSSDFWQIASLLFSDAGIVTNYLNEFLSSLLETLPALSISLFLAPIFSFLLFQYWSLRIRNPYQFISGAATLHNT